MAEIAEEFDVQQRQQVADFPLPVLQLVAGQLAFLGEAAELGMQRLQQEAHILGPGLAENRLRSVLHRNGVALGDQRLQFGNALRELGVVLVQRQQAFAEVQFEAAEQQLECGRHELAGQRFGYFRAAP
ncbi:hypothetical protein D3C81_1843970 [compost metagenome]